MTEISYARTRDGAFLAYSVVGDGPLDLVYTGGYMISIDSYDDEPHVAHMWRRLSSFARLIRFDVRGVGMSDPIDAVDQPTIDTMAADLLAVVDAAGASEVCLVGDAGAGGSAIEFAALHADRLHSLVLVNSGARYAQSEDYPYGYPAEFIEAFLAQNTDPDEEWTVDGGSDDVALIVPSLADDVRFREWWTRASRRSASPATARATVGCNVRADLRARLPEISVPTLVLHAAHNAFAPVELGRYLGEHLPNATYIEVATADSAMWGAACDDYIDQIEDFTTGQRRSRSTRVLATILFSDIVASTEQAATVGDRAWRSLLDTHDQLVRAELARYGGREINTTGDGFIATFDSPTQAVSCGQAIVSAASRAELPVRIGIHTGECERRGADLAGLAVHVASRVSGLAGPNEIITSRTVRDLSSGSGIAFIDRGVHTLKGVPDSWQLYSVPTEGPRQDHPAA
jgi:class 3 adenylate cyclase